MQTLSEGMAKCQNTNKQKIVEWNHFLILKVNLNSSDLKLIQLENAIHKLDGTKDTNSN